MKETLGCIMNRVHIGYREDTTVYLGVFWESTYSCGISIKHDKDGVLKRK